MPEFYLGLDIGTDSVGAACTDGDYRLLRAKGKDCWAVRLLDKAESAESRRGYRTARRRLQRRRQRIALLQEIFAPFMTDENFFLRLKNSGYLEEDKAQGLNSPYAVFADADYTDKQFYAEFPTIFHLRQRLIERGSSDLRLYYLAVHHIVRYRGHFLFDGDSVSDTRDIAALFEEFNNISANVSEEPIVLDAAKAVDLKNLFTDQTLKSNDKKTRCLQLFGSDKRIKEVITFILGYKGNPSKVFGGYEEEKSFSFDIPDEEFAAKAEVFGDDFALLDCMRKIYNCMRFEKILHDCSTVSEAMISIYETHRADLKDLKRLLGYYPRELYVKILKRADQKNNYANYIGYTKPQKKKINVKKCSYDDFIKYLKTELAQPPADAEGRELYAKIYERIEEKTFLPKILNADNGTFPHQINLAELDKILENLKRDFPAFAQKDVDGLSPAEKIRKLFKFRVPYYVGPLNAHGEHAWIVKREERPITPWNFKDVVDEEKSAEEFIRRMTNRCTYLICEYVLPKYSMYYQAFDTLNQLNKLKINGELISTPLKQQLFNELFLKYSKVSDKRIKDYLKSHGFSSESSEIILSGKDGDFNASMSAYITFYKKFGDMVNRRPDIFENIILWHTLNTDKNLVERSITANYGDIPQIAENIKWLKGLTQFTKFGRLSHKFLCGLSGGENPVTRAPYTILGELYNTSMNLNEILYSEKYNFLEAIKRENGELSEEVTYEDVKNLYVSPAVRRGIWQALKMVDEYVAAIGRAPDKIFVEVTRHDEEEKKRTVSRKKQLIELYSGVKDCDDLYEQLINKSESDLQSDRLYLYFRQLGRCMYSGKKIDPAELKTDVYDIDHIIPQSIVKDDSLDNRVLVLREKNMAKSDNYPLPEGLSDQQKFWKILRDLHLISNEKYTRLTRRNPLTDEEINSFINRQLTFTNQTAKAVAELLARKFEGKNTKIVYSKASAVSEFRHKFSIVKCRETNDLHHARDAYLNIVVGNVYNVRFGRLRDYYYKNKDGDPRRINLDKLFTYDIEGAWNKDSLPLVMKTVARNSIKVTSFPHVYNGKFYDETVYSHNDSGLDAPRKGKGVLSDVKKYGGYGSLKTAYFSIVESVDKKGRAIKTIERIPVLTEYNCRGNADKLIAYLEAQGLKSPRFIVEKLRIKTLVKVNGFPCYIAGITGNRIVLHNAVQWYTDGETDRYVKALLKVAGKQWSEEEKLWESYPLQVNRLGEIKYSVTRADNEKLYRAILNQLCRKEYSGISAASTFKAKLENLEQSFLSLSVYEQVLTLISIIKFLKCDSQIVDLSILGDCKNCGKLLISKNITEVDFRIVHQSTCGLDEREIKL